MIPEPLVDLANAVAYMLDLSDGAGQFVPTRARRARLGGAWILVGLIGGALWYWRTGLLATFGALFALGALVWVFLTLVLLLATAAAFEGRPSRSSPRSRGGAS